MTPTLGVVMDPIATVKIHKDSTFAMLLEGQRRGWPLRYMEQGDLFLQDGVARARMRELVVRDDPTDFHRLGEPYEAALASLDVVLMRKDPPVDMEYVYATHLLEQAERAGVLVVNRPAALRDTNEKLATACFPDLAPATIVCRDIARLRAFLRAQGSIVVKPLAGMGGASVFRVHRDDPNANVIFETLTDDGRRFAMAQRFIPEIRAGDKRILLVDGTVVPYALARIPAAGESRGNLAAGGSGQGVELSSRDREIAQHVAKVLRERGIVFAGIDVIGDYLTEVNVTSPTCIRELDDLYGLNIAGQLLDAITSRLSA